MPGRQIPPPFSPAFSRQLAELMQTQEAQRRSGPLDQKHELTELRALARLAHELWGDAGFVRPENGLKLMGYFSDGRTARVVPGRPVDLGRNFVIAFAGASYAEIHAQVTLYRTSTVA